MTTLYLDHANARIQREGQSIALYTGADRQGTFPLKLLDRVVLRGRVTLEASVLAHLAHAGIPTLILAGRKGREVAMVLGDPHNDATRRIAQCRAWLDAPWRLDWTRRLVALKLKTQARLLDQASRRRPDQRRPLFQGRETIRALASDALNAAHAEQLLGIEGAGAAAYFRAYATLLPAELEFHGRNRRPPRDPVNAALSLGYTLLHADAVQALHRAGLDPLIGFYHAPSHGRASLAADFIEPLRASFDRVAWELFRDQQLRRGHFTRDGDAWLLGKAGRHRFFAAYEHWAGPVRRLLLRHAYRLQRELLQTFPLSGDDHDA